jgi:hypothetical protein
MVRRGEINLTELGMAVPEIAEGGEYSVSVVVSIEAVEAKITSTADIRIV